MINQVIQIANKFESRGEVLFWYLFGSYLRSPHTAKDLDILIIYEDIKSPKEVRLLLNSSSIKHPIDLIFMTKEEEEGFNFIEMQSAEQVYPFR